MLLMFWEKFATIETMIYIWTALPTLALFLAAVYFEKQGQNNRIEDTFAQPYEAIWTAALFALGILLRVLFIGRFPAGLNQDEASIGYDAYADLTFGVDRNGYHNPVYSVAWGSGHSGLYILLLKLSIRYLGLSVFSVRLPNAVFASLALFAFYGFLRQLRGRRFAQTGLFLLAVNPWHIMMARWGLECNLFPNVFIMGLYCLVRGRKSELWYLPALILFGLSLYGYGTAYMFIPVFLLVCALLLLHRGELRLRMMFSAAALFVLTAVPIGVFMLVNVCGLPEQDWGILSFPRLIDGRYNTTVTVLGGSFWMNCLQNLGTFVRLLVTQNDELIWNAIPSFGTMYLFSMPLALGGVYLVLRTPKHPAQPMVWGMLAGSLVLASFSELNINRANVIYVLLIYGLTEGVYYVSTHSAWVRRGLAAAYAISFALFAGCYFGGYQAQIGSAFFEGFGEAVQQAAVQTEETVYLTEEVNSPYIYALFYEKTDSHRFLDTVVYEDENSSVRRVVSFDRYVTGLPEEPNPQEAAAYVAAEQETELFDDEAFTKTPYGNFYVIVPKTNVNRANLAR